MFGKISTQIVCKSISQKINQFEKQEDGKKNINALVYNANAFNGQKDARDKTGHRSHNTVSPGGWQEPSYLSHCHRLPHSALPKAGSNS